jgi:hypothetical protein
MVGLFPKKFTDGITKVFSKSPSKSGGGMFGNLNQTISKINPKQMLAAGAAMGMVAGSVWILSKAMQNFSEGVTWDGVLMGIAALGALTVAVVALGAIMMSGVGAIAILAGATAMGMMAGSVWILSEALQNFSKYSSSLVSFFKDLSQINGSDLFVVAGGIGAISAALAAFSVSSVMNSISNSISNIFGGSFIDKLNELSLLSNDLNIVAMSIDLIANSLQKLSKIDISDVVTSLNDIDTNLNINYSGNGKMTNVTGVNTKSEIQGESVYGVGYNHQRVRNEVVRNKTIENNVNTITTSENVNRGNGVDNTEINILLKKLIEKIDSPVQIKIGNKVINELTKQQIMKKNIQFGID